MINLYSNNVDFYKSLDRYYFDEDFSLQEFSINYELDNGSFGRVDFEPRKGCARVFLYSDLEDLAPSYFWVGLENSSIGCEMRAYADEGNLGRTYRAALDWVRMYFKDRA